MKKMIVVVAMGLAFQASAMHGPPQELKKTNFEIINESNRPIWIAIFYAPGDFYVEGTKTIFEVGSGQTLALRADNTRAFFAPVIWDTQPPRDVSNVSQLTARHYTTFAGGESGKKLFLVWGSDRKLRPQKNLIGVDQRANVTEEELKEYDAGPYRGEPWSADEGE